MRLRFLGTGDSAGMPVHNCHCRGCEHYRKEGRKNYPTSALIELEDGVIMLDAGYDDICWEVDGTKIHAAFVTHFHADHVYGLLRLRFSQDSIPVYHPEDDKGFDSLYRHPQSLVFTCNTPFEPLHVKGITVIPIPLKHSKNTTGYLIKTARKTIAYLTDCSGISEESLAFLHSQKLDAVFLDACYAPDFDGGNHLNFHQASELMAVIGPKEGFLVHMCHQNVTYMLEHAIISKYPYIQEGFTFSL